MGAGTSSRAAVRAGGGDWGRRRGGWPGGRSVLRGSRGRRVGIGDGDGDGSGRVAPSGLDPEKKREGEEDKAEIKWMDRASRGEEEIKSRGVGSTTLVGRPELELGAVNRRLSIALHRAACLVPCSLLTASLNHTPHVLLASLICLRPKHCTVLHV